MERIERGHKLGIIVPYRNRPEQLDAFKSRIINYLHDKNIDYEIIIVSQDNGKLFNRGMLLNIGFKISQKLRCDYVVFHDVDMLPVDVDYSYSDIPLHLATKFIKKDGTLEKLSFDEYFGGVTLFPSELFKKINGYSNKYWGWGFEDDDLLLRCKYNNIPLDILSIDNYYSNGKVLTFNGVNSYVKCKNNISLNDNLTFFTSFFVNDNIYDEKKTMDNFSIFSFPGYDTTLTYNSFLRYNFCTFDTSKKSIYINSKIKTNYSTNIAIVIDSNDKKIKMYQDGELIDEKYHDKRLMSYKNPFFYIGVGDPTRKENNNYFSGWLNEFVIYSDVLSDVDINILSTNKNSIRNYKSYGDVLLHYNSNNIKNYKLTDLSGNENDGKIYNCDIKDNTIGENKKLKVPYRKESTFLLLPHENNGFEDNKWKTEYTRWNQLRFYNEVSKNNELLYNDGLSDLIYTEHGKVKNDKITHIDVGL